ncbi:phosphoenolpyruvate--protein phosphotransferase [Victivallis sp. Marseille-Q1083]|uniref:phosphoenolpyruvate--protein phosphotransferase n=1 Tax=Victivallis sp. Marseille-Q1083 TaxID=2717288 RepID=UPI001588FF44|nr:phosphoenolpyruvate--protein phosphotransferase [Victivallis sp. Marseille-Q1083]
MTSEAVQEKIHRGIAASPGFAIGKVLVVKDGGAAYTEPPKSAIAPEAVFQEIQRFEEALEKTRNDLTALQTQLQEKVNAAEARILDAHLLILDDQMLQNEVTSMIRNQSCNAEYAFYKIVERYVKAIMMMSDNYIKERAADIRDVAARVLAHLQNFHKIALNELLDQRIIIADELTPSDTAALDRSKVLGFAITTGSKTSHTAILARSMQLPALVGIPAELLQTLHTGDKIIIDGFAGILITAPAERTEELYRAKIEEESKLYSDLTKDNRLRPETLDGFMVQLSANIESVSGLDQIARYGACGIGLFRTEYLFLSKPQLPTEDEQYTIYRQLLDAVGNDPVIIRTLDIGGDKMEQSIQRYAEANPFLGLRGIRLCLHECRDLLRTQLRALLRASVHGTLRVMLPMISCVEEVIEVKALIKELQLELRGEKREFAEHLELGAMIETPVAALMVNSLAGLVDFFSLGTNDLIQYTMAIDRSNERVAYLYQPTHPAVLELIWRCAQEARRHNIWVSVCGQMAGDPRFTALLVGLGVHELSMPPQAVAPVRRVIRQMRLYEAEATAQAAMSCSTADDAMKIAVDFLNQVAPEISQLVVQ